jgi:hypothetical protein
MGNSILTIDMITRKALEILENELVLTRNVNRQYDDSFAVEGAKIGSTLRIRKPDRALVTDGAALQVQDTNEQFTTLTVSSQKHIGVNFTSAELTLQLDDFADRVLKPRISQLASSIDADVAAIAYKGIYQSVGTPGTTPATSLVLLQGQQKLNEAAAMRSPRYATVNPAANAGLVEGMKGLFNPTDTVSRQFRSGMMGVGVLGYEEINMSQSISNHTTGVTPTAPIVAATVSVQGQATLDISFTSGSPTFKIGDVFTIANVYGVNPQTRQSTGSLQQFVVTEDLTISSATTGTLKVSPPMYTAAHALATISAFPVVTSGVLTFLGGSATGYAQNLIYHKDAITFATADLLLPQGVDMASRQSHNGISMRIVRQYDINNDRLPCRIDVLYGAAVIRPEMGVRLWG